MNRLYAWLGGYSWKPCPICGRKFGGHQWRNWGGHEASIPVWGASTSAFLVSTAICPRCTRNGIGDALCSIRGWRAL